jgi:crotonobetainyl-CoA:carnitine CoA-transferase CaiB-like acyl-CoA transferase
MAPILEGIRVLDFGRYIAGPYAAGLLADLGADVIRVEQVEGADDRYLMPATLEGEGAMYIQCNRNKRAITLAMGTAAGRAIQRRLVEKADVIIANFSPKALEHFGLDYAALKAIRPDIILTTISAFGSEGPLREKVGFDGVGQAVSGAIYLSGRPDQPYRAASSYIDFSTAISAAFGTLAALIHRSRTGEGQHVEGSLVATGLNIMNPILIEEFTGVTHREPTGNRSPISGPSDVFRATDGWFIMQAVGQSMFKRWARMVGRPELIDDPLYADDIARGRNGEELSRIMQDWCKDMTRDAVLATLAEWNIGASPVLSPVELIGGAMGLRDSFLRVTDYPGTKGVPIARPPVRFSSQPEARLNSPPTLGQHTAEVYAELGFAPAEIECLRAEGVI